MIIVEASEKICNNLIFTLSGDTDTICNGYEFSHEQKKYRVQSVAMVCNKEKVQSDYIDVIVEEV